MADVQADERRREWCGETYHPIHWDSLEKRVLRELEGFLPFCVERLERSCIALKDREKEEELEPPDIMTAVIWPYQNSIQGGVTWVTFQSDGEVDGSIRSIDGIAENAEAYSALISKNENKNSDLWEEIKGELEQLSLNQVDRVVCFGLDTFERTNNLSENYVEHKIEKHFALGNLYQMIKAKSQMDPDLVFHCSREKQKYNDTERFRNEIFKSLGNDLAWTTKETPYALLSNCITKNTFVVSFSPKLPLRQILCDREPEQLPFGITCNAFGMDAKSKFPWELTPFVAYDDPSSPRVVKTFANEYHGKILPSTKKSVNPLNSFYEVEENDFNLLGFYYRK